MPLVWIIVLFIVGLVLIIKGGDWFVDASSWIAEKSGIPKFIIGATVVSFATTLPELLVSVLATVKGNTDIAIGNALGSVTSNVGLIMGISMVCLPSFIKRKDFAFKGLLMAFSCVVLYIMCIPGKLNILNAVILLLIFAVFATENVLSAKKTMLLNKSANYEKEGNEKDKHQMAQTLSSINNVGYVSEKGEAAKTVSKKDNTVFINIVKFVLGAAGIVGGAQLLVNNGEQLALKLGVPDTIIGFTLVAVGTSLPELVTTITAIIKKEASLSIGNIVGANIIDLTVILPICALISANQGGLIINSETIAQNLYLDFPVCLALILIAVVPTLIFGRYRRAQGIVMLAGYAAYVVVLCLGLF